MDDRMLRFHDALAAMDRVRCRTLLQEVLGTTRDLRALEEVLAPAMERLGQGWEEGRVALTQVFMGGRICEDLLTELLPPVPAEGGAPAPRIGLAVFQDSHQLGKRIVGASLRAGGFEVLDYGHGLHAADLAQRALADRVPVLMVSVLMLNSALHLADLRRELGTGPEAPRLVVGGAPFRFDRELWRRVGADAVGYSGLDALGIARRLVEDACAP